MAAGGLAACAGPIEPPGEEPGCPRFLRGYEAGFAADPGNAARAWFRDAGRGLFLRYGVYSQLGRGPAVQFDERIPPARYNELKKTFDPSGFDAERIGDLALESGMGYVGLSARHADGFCLFRTVQTDFNSLENSGRDLVDELAASCRARGLGMILSYSYAADWRHPYFFPAETSRTQWRGARPAYEARPAEYRFEKDEDFLRYTRYAHNHLQEIAYRYHPVAGIRLEPAAGYHARPDLFPVEQAYEILREARAGILVAFGLGANGDEDFAAASRQAPASIEELLAARAWSANRAKPLEICLPVAELRARESPESAAAPPGDRDANLLVRADLAPDGSLAPPDERTLLELGARRRA